MSIFSELLPKIIDIPKKSFIAIEQELEAALKSLQQHEDEYFKSKQPRERAKDILMTTLQSINEDEDELAKSPEKAPQPQKKVSDTKPRSKKRSKDEVDGKNSPEQDKRVKRNASVKAQSNISKQAKEGKKHISNDEDLPDEMVNVNLSQKLRRESPGEGQRRTDRSTAVPPIKIKQEKMSIVPPVEPPAMVAPEPVVEPTAVQVKQERLTDMPPPSMPAPRGRGKAAKQASSQDSDSENETRRSTRARKPKDMEFPAPVSTRSSRASTRSKAPDEDFIVPPEPRPKRTRTKKKLSESSNDAEKENTPANIAASPPEKPRPKRTRRGQKAAEAEAEKLAELEKQAEEAKSKETESQTSAKEQKQTKPTSPVQQKQETNKKDETKKTRKQSIENKTKESETEIKELKRNQNKKETTRKSDPGTPQKPHQKVQKQNSDLDKNTKKLVKQLSDEKVSKIPQKCNPKAKPAEETKPEKVVVQKDSNPAQVEVQEDCIDGPIGKEPQMDVTVTLSDMNSTMVLPNAVYNHAPVTPQNIREARDATVVLERCDRETIVLEGQNDTTMVLHKDDEPNVTEDDSVLTDDASMDTPPRVPPKPEPTSAVKQKVQQFEQLAARTTRTKTRQLEAENKEHTPPQGPKPTLSVNTLDKMNAMIFNGKQPMISTSASKPRLVPPPKPRPASASKASALSRQHEESLRQKETARQKKEALLEAKREQQRKKREEKIAAAAMAREQAERDRKLAMEAAARERQEKQAHADMDKMQRKKEMEKKKLEQARKVAETEERRRQEEKARQQHLQRLQEEQRRADAARKKQLDEAEALKKEAALVAKEMEKRQKEYLEKQYKLKHGLDKGGTPMKDACTPSGRAMSPTYMQDGFQYLYSDDEDRPVRPKPQWCESKYKNHQLSIQSEIDPAVIYRLYPLVPMTPDLREIFPGISRQRIVRTSSAVWRTPPNVEGFLSRSRIESAR